MVSFVVPALALRAALLRVSVPVRRCSSAVHNNNISNSCSSGSSSSSGRLADELARLGDRVAHADAALQQQAGSLGLAQRQQAVLERRVAALEEAEARLARRIAEATRLASDVALRHKSVEALVQQVEQFVLSRPAQTITREPREEEKEKEKKCEKEKKKDEGKERVAELGRQVEALQARVEQLTLEKIVLQRLQPIAQSLQTQNTEHKPTYEAKETEKGLSPAMISEAVARVSGSAGPHALAEALRHSGAFPFKDSTGATRVSSQRVLVRGVPLTCGAAEVRVMCARVGQVVSCAVRQTSSSAAATSARYRSQEKEDAEEAEQTFERAFEVTFRSAEEAVRAVLQLNGHRLQAGAVIAVEPLVSADIVAALQQLEEQTKKKKKKETRNKK